MSQKIVESVQAIENQAQQLKEDFQKKIDEAKIQANQKISESKKNVDIALSNYEKELEDKYSQKKLDFQEELASLQKEEIQQIQQVFEANRQELVQETIKEVLKRYGNCKNEKIDVYCTKSYSKPIDGRGSRITIIRIHFLKSRAIHVRRIKTFESKKSSRVRK